MRTGIVIYVSGGMAAVKYTSGEQETSNEMPILATDMNKNITVNDKVVIAPLNGKKDGIILGKYWNRNNGMLGER